MTQFAFFDGQIRPIHEAKVSIMNHTFNYGTGCFGGIRAYWNEQQEQLYLFRVIDHYRRFLQSAKLLMANFNYTAEQLAAITVDLLAREGWRQNAYVRPLAYKADDTLGVRLHNLHDAIAIFSVPMESYIPAEEGARVGTSSWRRVDDTAIPARGKLIGSYVNSAFAKTEAVLNGFDEAIVLNQDGHVSESSASNVFIVRNGVLYTPPVHSNVLEGITQRSLMQLAREELGLTIVEREIDRTELYISDEIFLCGTGMQIASVISVDHRTIGSGAMGPITRQLRDLFFRVVRGEEPKYMAWLTPVPQLVPA